jgi:NADH:ubiquinone oxidoreductase subunit 5 (subunit L)/multisubunit Na+/H+ antiporter MnhA subunit
MALLMAVMLGPFGHLVAQWQLLIEILSILSMALGALAAIGQKNIKRLLAYSSIGNMGYALMGLAAGGQAGVQATLVYLAIYIVMSFGAFACIIAMRRRGQAVETIADLAGLSSEKPGFALALAIFMWAMAGIPPLSAPSTICVSSKSCISTPAPRNSTPPPQAYASSWPSAHSPPASSSSSPARSSPRRMPPRKPSWGDPLAPRSL